MASGNEKWLEEWDWNWNCCLRVHSGEMASWAGNSEILLEQISRRFNLYRLDIQQLNSRNLQRMKYLNKDKEKLRRHWDLTCHLAAPHSVSNQAFQRAVWCRAGRARRPDWIVIDIATVILRVAVQAANSRPWTNPGLGGCRVGVRGAVRVFERSCWRQLDFPCFLEFLVKA